MHPDRGSYFRGQNLTARHEPSRERNVNVGGAEVRMRLARVQLLHWSGIAVLTAIFHQTNVFPFYKIFAFGPGNASKSIRIHTKIKQIAFLGRGPKRDILRIE